MDVTHIYAVSLSFWLVLVKSAPFLFQGWPLWVHPVCHSLLLCQGSHSYITSSLLIFFSLRCWSIAYENIPFYLLFGEKYNFTNVKLPAFSLLPTTAKFLKVSTWHLFLIMLHHRSSAYGRLAFSHWKCTRQGLKNFSVAKFCRHFSILILLYTQEHLT